MYKNNYNFSRPHKLYRDIYVVGKKLYGVGLTDPLIKKIANWLFAFDWDDLEAAIPKAVEATFKIYPKNSYLTAYVRPNKDILIKKELTKRLYNI